MAEPTFFNCPHCTYAYQSGDPRFAVPAGQAARVMACPACGGMIRVHATGHAAGRRKLMRFIAAAIVVATIIYLVYFWGN
jgi:hypothetical protein